VDCDFKLLIIKDNKK